MKTSKVIILSIMFSLVTVSGAQAVDDGQTRPKLTSGGMSWGGSNLATDIIGLTSGSGNVKGFFCWSQNGALWGSNIQIYVDGGSAQTLNLSDAPATQDNDGITYYTGWVPLNVRFSTSVKVRLARSGVYDHIVCSVSWALD
jgi:hypothetical protein